ncbi:hypothetical protein ACFLU5_13405 [Bacteroidota bacterium]
MKIPSLTKIPGHRRFNFEPRYYDPVKEDISERTKRINAELKKESSGDYRHNISEAFRHRAYTNRKEGVTQWMFIVFFAAIFVGYLYYGNIIFYAFLALIPLYIFIKLRRRF